MFRPDNKVYLKGEEKMTKRHYVEIASGFNNLLKNTSELDQTGIWISIGMMIEIFKNDNPLFDEARFMQAVKKGL